MATLQDGHGGAPGDQHGKDAHSSSYAPLVKEEPSRPGRDDPGPGRRIGIDVGKVRIGIASSDPDGILATPVETVPRAKKRADRSDIHRICELISEYEAVEIVVGLPQTLRGNIGESAQDAIIFARKLAAALPLGTKVPIRFSDERFTTVTASRSLRQSGVRAKGQRAVIDQAAAVEILQAWLDGRKRTLAAATTMPDDTEAK